jgi:hypothetical protein
MKVFDFTSGSKGAQLADVPLVSATGGWLVRKGEKVYKVDFTAEGKPRTKGADFQWAVNASYAERDDNHQRTGQMINLRPEDFGVGAICFCQGKDRQTDIWRWYVIGTDEWNRAACVRGQLRATFSHMMPTPEEQEQEENVFA